MGGNRPGAPPVGIRPPCCAYDFGGVESRGAKGKTHGVTGACSTAHVGMSGRPAQDSGSCGLVRVEGARRAGRPGNADGHVWRADHVLAAACAVNFFLHMPRGMARALKGARRPAPPPTPATRKRPWERHFQAPCGKAADRPRASARLRLPRRRTLPRAGWYPAVAPLATARRPHAEGCSKRGPSLQPFLHADGAPARDAPTGG